MKIKPLSPLPEDEYYNMTPKKYHDAQINDSAEIEDFDDSGFGCRITYLDNSISCALHPTGQENYQIAMEALLLVVGYIPHGPNIVSPKVEFFRVHGGE